jgi:membrane associated rhomboid family serine protease
VDVRPLPGMSSQPPNVPLVDEDEQLFCYGHPKTPTRLRCSRCERPICGRCAIPASVGQHCPECVAEGRRQQRKVRSTFAAIAPAVRAIIIINVVAYVAQIILGESFTVRFASFPFAIANGEWWRLLTPMVLHAGVLHIFLNMYVLSIFGPIVEQAYKTRPFVVMYVICGFMGSVFSYVFGSCNSLGVGASGAIFGIAGAALVYFWRRRALRSMQPYIRSLLFFIGLNLLLGFGINFLGAGFRIDNLAHLGGLVAGGAVGAGFDMGSESSAPLVRAVTAVVVIGAGIALVAQRTATFGC